jgi:nicotinate-nucleotide adenylyltransferase
MPSYNSPHKDIDTIDTFNQRIDMLNLAFSDIGKVIISRFEEEYAKEYPNIKTYTYEILKDLNMKYPNYRLHFVVGFDSIKEISTWHRYLELIRDYEFLIFDRNDDEFKTFEQKKFYLDNLGKHQGIMFKYKFFDYKVPNISSTSIRTMLKNIDEYKNVLSIFIDSKVLQYILENNLYK